MFLASTEMIYVSVGKQLVMHDHSTVKQKKIPGSELLSWHPTMM